jgi:membrane fusion protein (multidrug efflux system)
MRLKPWTLLVGAVAAVAAGGLVWLAAREGAPPDWVPQPVAGWLASGDGGEARGGGARATPVRLATVERGRAELRFETSGDVLAAEAVRLSSEIAGRVARVLVSDGARVEAGAPVLRFETEAQEVALEAARAAREEAEADLSRARELRESGTVAEARVETALAAARRARAEVERAREALERRTVRAPFAGRLGFVDVSPGAWLRPGDPIARLETAGALRLRFSLPLEAARAARDAGRAAIRGREESCGSAPIAAVSPLNDPATRSRVFEARLPEGCPLAPGAFAVVSVVTQSREDALFVPQTAVLREGFEAAVFRAERDGEGWVARRAAVELGPVSGARIEVREGLAAGDRVVARGAQKLRDGAAVAPEAGGGE